MTRPPEPDVLHIPASGDGAARRRFPCRMHRALGLLLVALGIAVNASAQPSDPAAGAWMSSWADGPTTTGLSPSVWAGHRGLGYSVGGTFTVELFRPAEARGAALEFAAHAAGGSIMARGHEASMVSARVATGRSGLWFGAALLDLGRRESGVLPIIGAGTLSSFGRFTFGMRTVQVLSQVRTSSRLTIPGTFPLDSAAGGIPLEGRRSSAITANDYRLLTGAEATAGWGVHRLELQSRTGVMVALRQAPGTWGELRAAYWPIPGWAVFARARTSSGMPEALESVHGTHAALGVQLTPGRGFVSRPNPRHPVANGPLIRPVGDGNYSMRIHARARRVEVRSDATDWNPVPALSVATNLWEVVLKLAPGVHRVAVSIDGGAWRPPPGTPSTPDDFGGHVGLIVVD